MRRASVIAAAHLALTGCYLSHELADAGHDAAVADAGSGPCVTQCDPARVIAHVSMNVLTDGDWTQAVLDAAVVGDELVVVTLDELGAGDGTEPVYSRVRVSLRTGEVTADTDPALRTTRAVTAASIRLRGEGVRIIALRSSGRTPVEPQSVSAIIATWETLDARPSIEIVPLTDAPIAGCVRCVRLGAAILQDDDRATTAVTTDAAVRVVDLDLDTLTTSVREIPIAGIAGDAPLSDGAGSPAGVLFVGGGSLSTYAGSLGGPAFAIGASGPGALSHPVPGDDRDPTPFAIATSEHLEVIRFLHRPDRTTGELARFEVTADGLVELARISTAGGLPPRAMASTARALVWAEPDLATSGAANLRVIAHRAGCAGNTPADVAHLPYPLIASDLRVLAAASSDGHTYALFLQEVERMGWFMTVLDLGDCRAERR